MIKDWHYVTVLDVHAWSVLKLTVTSRSLSQGIFSNMFTAETGKRSVFNFEAYCEIHCTYLHIVYGLRISLNGFTSEYVAVMIP